MSSVETSPGLGGVDWLVIVIYLAAVIGLGVWLGRGQRNTRDYFLGGRDLPWWGVALSILATETSALTFIGVPAMAYAGNLGFMQIVLGYAMGRVILAVVMVPYYFRKEIYSPYALLGGAFGVNAQKLGALFFLVAGTLGAGVRVFVTCIPLQLILGWSIAEAIILFVGLSLIYTWFGGIKAVVWTDALQFVLLLAGGLFALLYLPTLIDGGLDGALGQAEEAGKLTWLNFDFSLAAPYNFWMGIIGAVVFVLFTHGIDQLVAQRVLACRSVADGRKALVFCAVSIVPMMLLFLLVGVLLWVHYQHAPIPIDIPENSTGKKQTDYVFPIFMLAEAPVGIKGLLFVGIFAAAMSSVSSALSALASVSTMDLGLVGKPKDEAAGLRVSRWATVFWGGLLIVVAFLSREITSVMNAAFSLVGLTSGALLGGIVISLVVKRGAAWPVITGMIASLVGMIWVNSLLGMDIPPTVIEDWLGYRELDGIFNKLVHWPWYTLIGAGILFLVSVPLLFVAKPKPHVET
ncbi:MAG: sodium:solute symporter [Verrucomicrobiales bacterium]|nr:sodium:solute symporter [Verrucomicrobiales bacterium]